MEQSAVIASDIQNPSGWLPNHLRSFASDSLEVFPHGPIRARAIPVNRIENLRGHGARHLDEATRVLVACWIAANDSSRNLPERRGVLSPLVKSSFGGLRAKS